MTANNEIQNENNNLDLLTDLQERFGPSFGQAIWDEIQKSAVPASGLAAPDYMAVKMVSEAAEAYRAEAKALVKKIKLAKRVQDPSSNVIDFDIAQAQKHLQDVLDFYRRLQAGYFVLWHRAMAACAAPGLSYTTRMAA